MTSQQKSLVRYWLTGVAVLTVILSLRDHDLFRLFVLLALPVVFVIDKAMRPPRPEGAPTPLEVVENSRAWKSFIVLYAVAAVILAVLAVSIGELGSWLGRHSWLLVPLILVPIAGPVVQSQIALYRAYGEEEG